MTLRQLKVFSTVAKLKSFSEAGKDLGASPSSVSTAIAALERELEAKLVERLGNRIELTDSGKDLLDAAREILHQVESIQEKIAHRTILKKE